MLYQILMRLVERGAIAGLTGKINVFYAAGYLTVEEYTQLMEELETPIVTT